jgi:hypothetical protein
MPGGEARHFGLALRAVLTDGLPTVEAACAEVITQGRPFR